MTEATRKAAEFVALRHRALALASCLSAWREVMFASLAEERQRAALAAAERRRRLVHERERLIEQGGALVRCVLRMWFALARAGLVRDGDEHRYDGGHKTRSRWSRDRRRRFTGSSPESTSSDWIAQSIIDLTRRPPAAGTSRIGIDDVDLRLDVEAFTLHADDTGPSSPTFGGRGEAGQLLDMPSPFGAGDSETELPTRRSTDRDERWSQAAMDSYALDTLIADVGGPGLPSVSVPVAALPELTPRSCARGQQSKVHEALASGAPRAERVGLLSAAPRSMPPTCYSRGLWQVADRHVIDVRCDHDTVTFSNCAQEGDPPAWPFSRCVM